MVLCNWFYMFLKCNFFCFKLIPKDKEKKNLKQVLVKNNFYIKKGYSVTQSNSSFQRKIKTCYTYIGGLVQRLVSYSPIS